jgi:hypothetical protein
MSVLLRGLPCNATDVCADDAQIFKCTARQGLEFRHCAIVTLPGGNAGFESLKHDAVLLRNELAGGFARDGLDVPGCETDIFHFAVAEGRELGDRAIIAVPGGVTGFQCLKHDNVLSFRFSAPDLFRRLFVSFNNRNICAVQQNYKCKFCMAEIKITISIG